MKEEKQRSMMHMNIDIKNTLKMLNTELSKVVF